MFPEGRAWPRPNSKRRTPSTLDARRQHEIRGSADVIHVARCLGSHRTSWHNRDSGRCFSARLRRSQSCSRRSGSSVCSPIYVTQRTQEVGIRVAPGAQSGDMVWMIVTHGLKLVASGIAIGIAAAIPLARVMRSMLLGLPDRYADVRRCNRGARGGSGSRELHSCTAGNARRPDRGAADRVSSADPCEACEPYAKILRAFEFPALRVMAAGSFEPTYHPSESRRRVVCMPL